MREFRCDVVHSHLWQADLLTGLAAAVAGVPVRVTTIHGDYFDFVSSRAGWQVRRFLAQRSYRAIYTLFDRVIAVADFVADRLVTTPGYGVRKDAIVRIHTGFDFARLAAVRGANDGSDELRASGPVIVTVGRFSGYKGHRYLVDAMPRVLQRFPDATFLLVGAGTTLLSIEEQVARLGIESSVRFVGESPDALELIAGADVMALSSLSEGLPLALLEAHALGKPIVASAVGGSPELVQDGVTGFLVPPRDPPALADAIIALLSDGALRRSFGERGQALVRDQFSAAAMVEQTERLYLELASSKGVTLDGEDL
jgi:glycosyltransferase involved in cell wall biosynthesis